MHKRIQYRAQMQYILKKGEEVARWVVVEIQPNAESLSYATLKWLNVTTYCLRCDWLIWLWLSFLTGHNNSVRHMVEYFPPHSTENQI